MRRLGKAIGLSSQELAGLYKRFAHGDGATNDLTVAVKADSFALGQKQARHFKNFWSVYDLEASDVQVSEGERGSTQGANVEPK